MEHLTEAKEDGETNDSKLKSIYFLPFKNDILVTFVHSSIKNFAFSFRLFASILKYY